MYLTNYKTPGPVSSLPSHRPNVSIKSKPEQNVSTSIRNNTTTNMFTGQLHKTYNDILKQLEEGLVPASIHNKCILVKVFHQLDFKLIFFILILDVIHTITIFVRNLTLEPLFFAVKILPFM